MYHQEVERIRKEHPDDDTAIVNDRVKGYLKVTRAFGAGFLKQVTTVHSSDLEFIEHHQLFGNVCLVNQVL